MLLLRFGVIDAALAGSLSSHSRLIVVLASVGCFLMLGGLLLLVLRIVNSEGELFGFGVACCAWIIQKVNCCFDVGQDSAG